MSSHGNGYADVVMRDAISQGRIERTTLPGVHARHRVERTAGERGEPR